jgi:hypothetical protein
LWAALTLQKDFPMVCIGCGNETGDRFDTCRDCEDGVDKWEAERPEREQRRREVLDSQGYYDNPELWRKTYGKH